MKKRLALWLVSGLLLASNLFSFTGCNTTPEPPYKTFTMQDGLADFTFEYSSSYEVEESGTYNGLSGATLKGPYNENVKDYPSIIVDAFVPNGPDGPMTDAKDLTYRAERNASSFVDYQLLNKSESMLDGFLAYRLDYMERDITPIKRDLDKPPIAVYREVRFDANGLLWFIQMRTDSSTAEVDKPDFEHVLETFKIID
jgi:hypothetical protein